MLRDYYRDFINICQYYENNDEKIKIEKNVRIIDCNGVKVVFDKTLYRFSFKDGYEESPGHFAVKVCQARKKRNKISLVFYFLNKEGGKRFMLIEVGEVRRGKMKGRCNLDITVNGDFINNLKFSCSKVFRSYGSFICGLVIKFIDSNINKIERED